MLGWSVRTFINFHFSLNLRPPKYRPCNNPHQRVKKLLHHHHRVKLCRPHCHNHCSAQKGGRNSHTNRSTPGFSTATAPAENPLDDANILTGLKNYFRHNKRSQKRWTQKVRKFYRHKHNFQRACRGNNEHFDQNNGNGQFFDTLHALAATFSLDSSTPKLYTRI